MDMIKDMYISNEKANLVFAEAPYIHQFNLNIKALNEFWYNTYGSKNNMFQNIIKIFKCIQDKCNAN